MIEVNLQGLPEPAFENYFKFLINKIFKVLPMKEEGSKTLVDYLNSLSNEMIGCYELYRQLIDEPQFLTVINIMQYLAKAEYDNKTCKREVFKAIRIIEGLMQKYGKE